MKREEIKLIEEEILDLSNNIVFISAVAGGGKTTLIIKKIIKLILNNVELDKILVITYTREAVFEIIQRLEKKFFEWMNDDSALFEDASCFRKKIDQNSSLKMFHVEHLNEKINPEEEFYKNFSLAEYISYEEFKKFKSLHRKKINVSTFHAFCLDSIKEFSRISILNNAKILSEDQRKMIIFDLIDKEYQKTSFFKKNIKRDYIKGLLLNIFNEKFSGETVSRKSKPDISKYIFFNIDKIKKLRLEDCEINSFPKNIQNIINQIYTFLKIVYKNKKQQNLDYLNIFLTKKFETRKVFLKIENEITDKNNEKLLEIIDFLKFEIKFIQKKVKEVALYNLINVNNELKLFKNKIYNLYIEYKNQNNLLEFGDIIEYFYKFITNSIEKDNLLFKLNNKFDHLIFDEVQDNSEEQWGIIKILSEMIFDNGAGDYNSGFAQKSLFIVGDNKQSIYSFQRAYPKLFMEYKEYFKQKSLLYKLKFKYVDWNFCFRVGAKNLEFIDEYFNKGKFQQSLFIFNDLKHNAFFDSDSQIDLASF